MTFVKHDTKHHGALDMAHTDAKPTVSIKADTTVFLDATEIRVMITGADADARALAEAGIKLALKQLAAGG